MRTEPNNQPPMSHPTGRLLVFFFLVIILGACAGVLYFYEPKGGAAKSLAAAGEVFKTIFRGSNEEEVFNIPIEPKSTAPVPSEEEINEAFGKISKPAEAVLTPKKTGGTPPPKTSASAGVAAVSLGEQALCTFESPGGTPKRIVLISEIAWMGGTNGAEAEWVELKNNAGEPLDLEGWSFLSEKGGIEFRFRKTPLPAGGLALFVRSGAAVSGEASDGEYRGALSNSGEWLRLINKDCALIDEIDARKGWGSFGGDNVTKKTLERNYADLGWHTSLNPGGTPKAQNARGMSAAPLVEEYALSISIKGKGRIISLGGDLECRSSCIRDFPSGRKMIFAAEADPNYSFLGWGGICAGKASCEILLDDDVNLSAQFKKVSAALSEEGTPPAVSEDNNPSGSAVSDKIFIREVMAGRDDASSYEFIELYNSGDAAADMTGWSIKKKTSSGAESVLVSESRFEGKYIGAGEVLLLGNQAGYTGSPSAHIVWPSSYTLAYANNSVELWNSMGSLAHSVSWADMSRNKSLSLNNEGLFIEGEPTPGL